MTDSFDDPAFWLPTKFLDDDDVLAMDFGSADTKSKAQKSSGFGFGFGFDTDGSKALFPFEFGCGAFGVSSDLSSPVESVGGSSETESDEEEYLAGLTRKMARSTLDSENPKSWVLSGSPQSTLCAVGSGCGSPNAQSPPATWDLLHAAAGEVAKMRINQSRGLLGPPRKPLPASVPFSSNNENNIATKPPDFGYYLHHQSLSHRQFQATQFQRLRQQQMIKEQRSAVWGGAAQSQYQHQQQIPNHPMVQSSTRPLGLAPSAWPALQQAQQYQNNGSGFRANFLGNPNPGAKRESTGTGVFLPRQIGNQSHPRKKQLGGSTVIVPARVVQALNLNIDDIQQRRFNGRFTSDHDVALRLRSNAATSAAVALQKRNNRPQPPPVTNEIRLPQEWTY